MPIDWDIRSKRRSYTGCSLCGEPREAAISLTVRRAQQGVGGQGSVLASQSVSFCRRHADEIYTKLVLVLNDPNIGE